MNFSQIERQEIPKELELLRDQVVNNLLGKFDLFTHRKISRKDVESLYKDFELLNQKFLEKGFKPFMNDQGIQKGQFIFDAFKYYMSKDVYASKLK